MKRRLAAAGALALAVACSGDEEFEVEHVAADAETKESSTEDAATSDGPPSCSNLRKDGDETDVDCGGAVCPACANGRACAKGSDCASVVCAGGKCATDVGCADGTREAFLPQATFPNIAACAGAWALPGVVATTAPACGRASGNSSANPTGAGCNVADLCQPSWHVCATPAEVMAKSGGAGCAAATVAGQGAFYLVRVSGSGGAMCGAGTNDLFGCGEVGAVPDAASCAPLDRFSNDLCAALPTTFACGTDGTNEANDVIKTASEGGGVLCCRD